MSLREVALDEIAEVADRPRQATRHSAGSLVSATRPAPRIPKTAQVSSFSEVSPLMCVFRADPGARSDATRGLIPT
jgi:hypothetical protein